MPLDSKFHNLPDHKYSNLKRVKNFVNREEVLEQLSLFFFERKFRLICLFGEGGAGKTSLARYFASKIIDDSNSDFHSVVWTTAKTHELRVHKKHDNPIINSKKKSSKHHVENLPELYEKILEITGYPSQKSWFFHKKSIERGDVISWLKIRKTLIIIDDLDSWNNWGEVLEFADLIPYPSGLIITSRRSLYGSINGLTQLHLDPLSDNHIAQIAMNSAKRRLWDVPKSMIDTIARLSQGNPLFAKLAVGILAIKGEESAYKDYNRLLNFFKNSSSTKDYIFDDLFSRLSTIGKKVLIALIFLNNEGKEIEHILVSKLVMTSTHEVEYALQELELTSLINREPADEDKYDIHNLVKEYATSTQSEFLHQIEFNYNKIKFDQ